MPQQRVDSIPIAPVIKELTDVDVYPPGENEGTKKILCPFHEERHPSASVSYYGFTCFACDMTGDAYKLIMQVEGVPFNVAKRRAQAIVGSEGSQPSRKRRRSSELLGYEGS